MEKYRIRVNNEAGADEARDLFKKLGYHPDNSSYKPYVEWIAVFEDGSGSFYSHNVNLNECVEITIAQLRDLVVLKRNDINDANWETEGGDQIFKDSNDKSFIYRSDGWDELLRHEMRQAMWEKPKAIAKPQSTALISGADALRALADGKEVEGFSEENEEWIPIVYFSVQEVVNGLYKFRLKPQTIKLELELPKPFEPKKDETYWYLTTSNSKGYDWNQFQSVVGDEFYCQFGAWRTEAEVKQVVEQLRKIKGAV